MKKLLWLACGVTQIATLFAQEPSQKAPRVQKVAGISRGNASYLGVGVVEVDSDRAKALHLKEERGVEVKNVDEGSPAAKAGLKEGDVILDYNSQRIEGLAQFVRMVSETPVGRKASMGIFRNGANQTLTTTIGLRTGQNFAFSMEAPAAPVPPMPPMATFTMPDIPTGLTGWQSSSLGYMGESVDGQLAEYFGVREGVLVHSVVRRSPAEKAGLKAGDVIVKVDGTAVKTPREITAIVRRSREKKTLSIGIVRNHKDVTVEISALNEWSSERMRDHLIP